MKRTILTFTLVCLCSFFEPLYAGPIQAPHGLGQFHEEPTGYRPSMRGATRYVLSVEAKDEFTSCMTKTKIEDTIAEVVGSYKPSPNLGINGPADFPQSVFAFSFASGFEARLSISIFLFLPKDILAADSTQKILSFQYEATHPFARDTCKENLKGLIKQGVDVWMREYGFYNGQTN